jgi:hypothetical protein
MPVRISARSYAVCASGSSTSTATVLPQTYGGSKKKKHWQVLNDSLPDPDFGGGAPSCTPPWPLTPMPMEL